MSPNPRRREPRSRPHSGNGDKTRSVTPTTSAGNPTTSAVTPRPTVNPAQWEPLNRFPLSQLGPEWFGPNWLTGTDWFGHWNELFPTRWPQAFPVGPAGETFRIEEYDDDDVHIIRAEIPGLDPDTDISIEVDHDILTVAATREEHTESRGETFRSEFSYGTLRRLIRLPAGSTAEDVSASYDAGVLEIRITRRGGERATVSIPVRQP